MEFNPKIEISKVRTTRKIHQKSRYQVSRLDRYKGELLSMHKAGATAKELQFWLKQKRIKVVHSTVYRWVKKHG